MDPNSAVDESTLALAQATEAAASADPKRMLEHLYSSFFLDGLARGLRRRWHSLSRDDIEFVIAQAVDALYKSVSQGKKILNLAAFLWKVADRKANDFYERRLREKAVDPEELQKLSDQATLARSSFDRHIGSDPEDDYERRRAEAVRIARNLLPRLGQQNIQSVFAYVLDALEAGEVDVPNHEIGKALGISPETVRTSLSRGFARLTRIARAEGLMDNNAELGALSEAIPVDDIDQ
jgi:RNA polymerase sigma factor (sigma-70 family)